MSNRPPIEVHLGPISFLLAGIKSMRALHPQECLPELFWRSLSTALAMRAVGEFGSVALLRSYRRIRTAGPAPDTAAEVL
ncbi:hypothetical protein [Rubrivivax gelatinosus]|uniref:hypothetical protein n=1 Tax=Rubrivivax gelatinosus TaxID=28068 RepID=UPI0005C16F92|nr:hypothetical protein [Rubrivivax gelatinosus]MBG6083187.1 hypothetical protein [Rubrivivax gelatinosus]